MVSVVILRMLSAHIEAKPTSTLHTAWLDVRVVDVPVTASAHIEAHLHLTYYCRSKELLSLDMRVRPVAVSARSQCVFVIMRISVQCSHTC